MPPKLTGNPPDAPILLPRLTRRPSHNVSSNGTENPIDPDAPREGRLASLKTRNAPPPRNSPSKIVFKPKAVQRRRKDGASESLLNMGGSGDDFEPSNAHLRRAERGRGTGRGGGRGARTEAPLQASGPFAQGPAIASVSSTRGRGTSNLATSRPSAAGSNSGPVRMTSNTKKMDKFETDGDEEANFDDAGQPMRNLLRMRDDASDFWAPVTTERIERAQKDTQIAAPGETTKLVKVKKEAEELGFIDVKTEPTESTITSRVPSPEMPNKGDVDMPDVPGGSAVHGSDDDDDIELPGFVAPSAAPSTEVKPKVEEKEKPKPVFKVMTAEEAEEQERLSTDLQTLRMSLARDPITAEDQERLIFIQLPDVLPYWSPGPDDGKNDGFAKEEEVKHEIVEIDQIAEDRKTSENPSLGVADAVDMSRKTVEAVKLSEINSGTTEHKANGTNGAPTVELGPQAEAPKKKKKKQKPMTFPPPEGCVGQLHIHKSGKITCEWGGIKMDVGTGSECGFLQEVVVVDPKTDKTAWSLGQVNSRIMLTPNLDDLLGTKG